ncbi:uncharacterized protein [Henckelia pumila]
MCWIFFFCSSHARYREMCDKCQDPKPVEPGQPLRGGGMRTIGTSLLPSFKPQAKRALKVYNKSNSKRFKVKKIYKINVHGSGYQCMTFSAKEDGSEGRTLFRAVVRLKDMVLFCEVKKDDDGPPPPRT